MEIILFIYGLLVGTVFTTGWMRFYPENKQEWIACIVSHIVALIILIMFLSI